MNNEEFNSSKPASEQESQASAPQVESSATVYESEQRLSPSQPENRNLLSSLSSEDENGATGNGTAETSYEDEPKVAQREPLAISVFIILRRMIAYAAELIMNGLDRTFELRTIESGRKCQQKIPPLKTSFPQEQDVAAKLMINEPDRTLEPQTTKSGPKSPLQTSFPQTLDVIIKEEFLPEFWEKVKARCNNPQLCELSIHDYEMEFFVEFDREVPSELPLEKLDRWNIPYFISKGPAQPEEIIQSEWAMARILAKTMNGENPLPEISGTSKPQGSSELCDSQPSSSAAENEMHESRTTLEHCELSKDYRETESCTLQDPFKDRTPPHESPRETQPSEMELKTEKNVRSSVESLEGPPIKKSKNHSK